MPLLPGAVISDDEDDKEEPNMTPVNEKIVLTSIEVGKYCLLTLSLAILINNLFEVLNDNFYDMVLAGPRLLIHNVVCIVFIY